MASHMNIYRALPGGVVEITSLSMVDRLCERAGSTFKTTGWMPYDLIRARSPFSERSYTSEVDYSVGITEGETVYVVDEPKFSSIWKLGGESDAVAVSVPNTRGYRVYFLGNPVPVA